LTAANGSGTSLIPITATRPRRRSSPSNRCNCWLSRARTASRPSTRASPKPTAEPVTAPASTTSRPSGRPNSTPAVMLVSVAGVGVSASAA
jgi:hypothetical protein